MCLAFSVDLVLLPSLSQTPTITCVSLWCSKLKVLKKSVRNVTEFWGNPKPNTDSEISHLKQGIFNITINIYSLMNLALEIFSLVKR
jgi:hypothetical protein